MSGRQLPQPPITQAKKTEQTYQSTQIYVEKKSRKLPDIPNIPYKTYSPIAYENQYTHPSDGKLIWQLGD